MSSPRSDMEVDSENRADAGRTFSLREAGAVAGLLTGIEALVLTLDPWLAQAWLIAGTPIAALADLHAALAAAFVSPDPVLLAQGAWPVMLALVVHAGSWHGP